MPRKEDAEPPLLTEAAALTVTPAAVTPAGSKARRREGLCCTSRG